MKNPKMFRALAAFFALALAAVVIFVMNSPAKMQKLDEIPTEAATQSAGKGSGLVRLLQGQTARVSAVNVGNKNIPLELIIADENGNVLILCDSFVPPGKAVSDTFSISDGTSNKLIYAQVRVRQNVGDLKELIPSLEIYDTQNAPGSGPHYVLSGNDFVEIRPIWVP